MKALTTEEIFLELIFLNATGSIRSEKNSSGTFVKIEPAQPTTPLSASTHNVLYVTLEKFRKHFSFMIIAACLKSIAVDNECIKICSYPLCKL